MYNSCGCILNGQWYTRRWSYNLAFALISFFFFSFLKHAFSSSLCSPWREKNPCSLFDGPVSMSLRCKTLIFYIYSNNCTSAGHIDILHNVSLIFTLTKVVERTLFRSFLCSRSFLVAFKTSKVKTFILIFEWNSLSCYLQVTFQISFRFFGKFCWLLSSQTCSGLVLFLDIFACDLST